MDIYNENLYREFVDKACEAFVMAIEVYNKPTLKYRTEGFSFFICNAWELMLKAKIMRDEGEENIYYKDSSSRTISLEVCIRKVFTNENDPLRKNLESIIELRNTSTHYITREYEEIYAPLFQACVFNLATKLYEFHGIDITSRIPEHFIHLAISSESFKFDELKSKYGNIISEKLDNTRKQVEYSIDSLHNNNFAIAIKHEYYLTKKQDGNASAIRIAKNDEYVDGNVRIIKEQRDINVTHPLNVKKIVSMVSSALVKNDIDERFTTSTFQDFVKYYSLKSDTRYCYVNTINKEPTYSYSQITVEFIVGEYKKDCKWGEKIHNLIRSREKNKSTPGARDF